VIVVGGGAVGLCVAESLASRGAEVTVLERGRCGLGASAGNAGWITPSLSIPVPGPGVIGTSLKWLVNPSGPLWIRPTLAPSMLAWLTRFVASCRRGSYRRGLSALQGAAALAGPAFDRLAERGVRFELHDEGLLYPAFDGDELEHLVEVAGELREAGAPGSLRRLTAGELRELEPAIGDHVVGGLLAESERRVRPELLTAGLEDALSGLGAHVLEHSEVTAVRREPGAWAVRTQGDAVRGDAVVLANGVAARRLLGQLGVTLPIVAAKGYSRTCARDPTGPQRPVYLEEPKVAISVFDGAVRMSGTLELGARGLGLSRRRLEATKVAAQRAMPGWRIPPGGQDWAGMRSLAPDGLPYIGAVPGLDGLHLATAHATLGITLAPATGELLAGLLLDRRPHPLLAAFGPGRAMRVRAPRPRPAFAGVTMTGGS
jgi:D-amino-acid dehydrogenase